MEFEEMQVIWDSQREQPMYALDIDAMHRKLKRKARKVERSISTSELGMIVICIFTAITLLLNPILDQTDYHQIFGAVVMLCVAAWMLFKRLARLKIRSQFATTLSGDLDCAIAESKAHLLLARTFHLWFLLPAASIMLVNIIAKSENHSPMVLLGLAGCFALSIGVVHLGIRCAHNPEQRDLQALRDTLTQQG